MGKIRDRLLYGYVQCELVIQDKLKANFAYFPPIFTNTKTRRNDVE